MRAGHFFHLNYFLFCTLNPLFSSSSAAFFIKQKFKLKRFLNPNSTCLGQAHSVVKIFQTAFLIAGQTKPLYLKRFFYGFFLGGGGGNPAKDLNFANETHATFKRISSPEPCSEQYGSHRWPAPRSVSPVALGWDGTAEPCSLRLRLCRPAFKATFLGKGRKEMTLSYI